MRTFTYAYDGAGNLSSVGVDGNPSTYALDARGLPTSLDPGTPADPSDDTAFTWDGAGLLTSVDAPGTASDRTFTYDGLGRLTAATASGSGITYVLDPFGRIASRTKGGTTESFTYEGTGFTLARRIRGSTTTLHASTPAGPLAERTGTTVSFYLSDPHGDILGLVQAGGTTPSSRAYGTPWGELSWSGTPPVLGFQSQYTDPATGAVATPARWYLPALSRFSSPDPLAGDPMDPLSLNRYAYAADDPITLADPTGLKAKSGGTSPHCGRPCQEQALATAEQRYAEAMEDEEPAAASYAVISASPKPGPVVVTRKRDALLLLGDYVGTQPLAAVADILKAIGRSVADGVDLVARCFMYLEACAHNVEIAISPLVTLGASVASLWGGAVACAFGGAAGCAAAVLGPIPAGIGRLWATYRHAREVWWGPNRDRIYRPLGPE